MVIVHTCSLHDRLLVLLNVLSMYILIASSVLRGVDVANNVAMIVFFSSVDGLARRTLLLYETLYTYSTYVQYCKVVLG